MLFGRQSPAAAAKRIIRDGHKMVEIHKSLSLEKQELFAFTHINKCLLLLQVTERAADEDSLKINETILSALLAANAIQAVDPTLHQEEEPRSNCLDISTTAFFKVLCISGAVAYVAGYNIEEPPYLRAVTDKLCEYLKSRYWL